MRHSIIIFIIGSIACSLCDAKDQKQARRFVTLGESKQSVESVYGSHRGLVKKPDRLGSSIQEVYQYAKVFPALKLGVQVVYENNRATHITYYKLTTKGKNAPRFSKDEIKQVIGGISGSEWKELETKNHGSTFQYWEFAYYTHSDGKFILAGGYQSEEMIQVFYASDQATEIIKKDMKRAKIEQNSPADAGK